MLQIKRGRGVREGIGNGCITASYTLPSEVSAERRSLHLSKGNESKVQSC